MSDTNTEPEPLAEPKDIVKVWRPLTDAETTRAAGLIESVSRAVRRTWRDVDARIAAGTLGAGDVADVVVWSVLPMLGPGADVPVNAKTYQQSSGSKSLSVTLDGPAGGDGWLEFAPWMVDVFAIEGTSAWPRSRFRSPAGGRFESMGFEWDEEPRGRSRDAARD